MTAPSDQFKCFWKRSSSSVELSLSFTQFCRTWSPPGETDDCRAGDALLPATAPSTFPRSFYSCPLAPSRAGASTMKLSNIEKMDKKMSSAPELLASHCPLGLDTESQLPLCPTFLLLFPMSLSMFRCPSSVGNIVHH